MLAGRVPIWVGKIFSSSSWFWTHVIRKSTYRGAETEIGFFTATPSAHMYSYFGPAHMTGQVASVQNSAMTP